jgi:uncharacterized protein (DUF433 family)
MKSQLLAPHIESVPDKCGGRPCIAGSRVRVQDVYVWHELQHMSPAAIVAEAAPQLTLSDVYAALSYCLDHLAEIRAEVELEAQEYDRAKQAAPSRLMFNPSDHDGNGNSLSHG